MEMVATKNYNIWSKALSMAGINGMTKEAHNKLYKQYKSIMSKVAAEANKSNTTQGASSKGEIKVDLKKSMDDFLEKQWGGEPQLIVFNKGVGKALNKAFAPWVAVEAGVNSYNDLKDREYSDVERGLPSTLGEGAANVTSNITSGVSMGLLNKNRLENSILPRSDDQAMTIRRMDMPVTYKSINYYNDLANSLREAGEKPTPDNIMKLHREVQKSQRQHFFGNQKDNGYISDGEANTIAYVAKNDGMQGRILRAMGDNIGNVASGTNVKNLINNFGNMGRRFSGQASGWHSNQYLNNLDWSSRMGIYLTGLMNKVGLGGLIPKSWSNSFNKYQQYISDNVKKDMMGFQKNLGIDPSDPDMKMVDLLTNPYQLLRMQEAWDKVSDGRDYSDKSGLVSYYFNHGATDMARNEFDKTYNNMVKGFVPNMEQRRRAEEAVRSRYSRNFWDRIYNALADIGARAYVFTH